MARKQGFEDMADYFGTLSKVDVKKITTQSLEDAANFFMEQLIPVIPESLIKKEHARNKVHVEIDDKGVAVTFENTAYYWRFVENGTPTQKAQLFASKTYQGNKAKIEELMANKIIKLWEG